MVKRGDSRADGQLGSGKGLSEGGDKTGRERGSEGFSEIAERKGKVPHR
jgi:hypothetical protein